MEGTSSIGGNCLQPKLVTNAPSLQNLHRSKCQGLHDLKAAWPQVQERHPERTGEKISATHILRPYIELTERPLSVFDPRSRQLLESRVKRQLDRGFGESQIRHNPPRPAVHKRAGVARSFFHESTTTTRAGPPLRCSRECAAVGANRARPPHRRPSPAGAVTGTGTVEPARRRDSRAVPKRNGALPATAGQGRKCLGLASPVVSAAVAGLPLFRGRRLRHFPRYRYRSGFKI
jgi:hypothetical protein